MKAAADTPRGELDMDALMRRGRELRVKRAVVASTLSLLTLIGGALTAMELDDKDLRERKSTVTPAQSPTDSACDDKNPRSDGRPTRYCIASGPFQDSEGMVARWAWYAYLDDEGELCDWFNEPGGGGGGCGGPKIVRDINPGLSSVDEQDPILDLELPVDTASAFVETKDGKQLPVNIYNAPPELGVSMKFGLYFELPIESERVVALDQHGSVLATEDLDLIKKDPLANFPRARGGSQVDFGYVGDELWDLSAHNSGDAPLHCVSIGIGNDQQAADVEFGANWCSPSDDKSALLFEQTWWSGLERFAPVFGSVPRTASSVTLELQGKEPQDVPILESPEYGMWPEPVYEMDFAVAFPPLGSEGRLTARADDGTVLSTWDLCLEQAATKGVAYTACDEATEFWRPPKK